MKRFDRRSATSTTASAKSTAAAPAMIEFRRVSSASVIAALVACALCAANIVISVVATCLASVRHCSSGTGSCFAPDSKAFSTCVTVVHAGLATSLS